MILEVVSVTIDAHQEQVAKVVERYDFLSLPVVDAQGNLSGVITVDDVLDVIRQEAEEDLLQMGQAGWGIDVSIGEHLKARWPWVALAFIGGTLCFSVVYLFGFIKYQYSQVASLWLVAAFIPMLLSLGATVGGQAATIAIGVIRSNKLDLFKWGSHLGREVQLGSIFAIILGAVVWFMGEQLFPSYELSTTIALATFFQIIFSTMIGCLIPFAFHRIGIDPTMASLPLFTVISDLSAIGILFKFFNGITGN